ncbi:hypothetical protein OHA25_44225 [Nonomuraea sp. NBC_00507]|uniref:hypothetical protein n=1 Tax=Nonomuraea sp. NBC_00507 TaxID=2976002 RepID=UPI002E19A802
MTAMIRRRGLTVAVASLAAFSILGGTAETASAHPAPGCNSRTYPGYTVRHLHLYGSNPAVAVCKAFKAIGGGKFQVFYKIKGRGGPRQVQVRNDGTTVRTYFVRGGTGTIKSRLQGHRTFFRTCRPDGTVCGAWQ